MSGRLSALVLAVCVAPLGACQRPSAKDDAQTIYLAGIERGTVTTTTTAGLPRVVTQTAHYEGGVSVQTRAVLTATGDVVEARETRTAPLGTRVRTLQKKAMGWMLQEGSRVQDLPVPRERPVVMLSLLGEVGREGPVAFVDLSTSEVLAGRLRFAEGKTLAETQEGRLLAAVDGRGHRFGPGTFEVKRGDSSARQTPIRPPVAGGTEDLASGSEVVLSGPDFRDVAARAAGQRAEIGANVVRVIFDDTRDETPPTPKDSLPTLAFEADAPSIVGLWKREGKFTAAQDALFAVENIHAAINVAPSGNGPPSGVATLRTKTGDCDDATALLVAWLRSRGHASRAVVGYRLADGVATPHAWAEYWTGTHWEAADAMWPAIGIIRTHVRLFEGLGSPFTIGRTLGAVSVVHHPASTAPHRATLD